MSVDPKIDRRIRGGLAWVGGASSAISVLDVAASLIVPAILGPEGLGIAAAAIWLFPIFDIFIDAGLGASLVRRENVTEDGLSSVFWINLLLSLVAAGIILTLAGPLTGHPIAAAMLTIYSVKLLFHNVYFVPQALLRRELRFGRLSVVRIGANVANTAVKLGTAFAGVGPWCFLYGSLAHALVTGVGLQICRPWRPRLVLRFRAALGDVRFGGLIAAREILYFFYVNIHYRVVLYHFGVAANGLYRFAFEIVLDPVRTISMVVNEVALPAFSRLRRDRAKMVEQYVAFTRMNLLVVLPFIAWLAIEIDDLIAAVPGWRGQFEPAARTVRILAGVAVLRSISFVIPPLLDALGRPMSALSYTIFASILMPTLYVVFALSFGDSLGHDSVAMAWAIGYPCAFLLLSWLALAVIDLRAGAFVRRVSGIPACVAGAALAACLVRMALPATMPMLRMAAVAATLLAVLLGLLARFQNLGPRRIAAVLRGRDLNAVAQDADPGGG